MHCARPHLGAAQSHARLCRTRPNPHPLRIHGHQAHLRHRSKPLHPHRDGPDRSNRPPKKDPPFPPNHRPSRKQLPWCPHQKLIDHRHSKRVHQQHPRSRATHPTAQIQSPRKRLECGQILDAALLRSRGWWHHHTHRHLHQPCPQWSYD